MPLLGGLFALMRPHLQALVIASNSAADYPRGPQSLDLLLAKSKLGKNFVRVRA